MNFKELDKIWMCLNECQDFISNAAEAGDESGICDEMTTEIVNCKKIIREYIFNTRVYNKVRYLRKKIKK